MIGKTISRYMIPSKLGEGGMGVVYRAEDTRLKDTTALNRWNAPFKKIQKASALDHPNRGATS